MTTSRVSSVLAYLVAKIKGDAELGAFFRDVTMAEFPICEEYPACNVNALNSVDDASLLGMPLKARVVGISIYITLSPDGTAVDTDLWDVVDAVRTLLATDKYLGVVNVNALLINPIIETNVSSIPSPFGTPLMGCRAIEFDAVLREQNY